MPRKNKASKVENLKSNLQALPFELLSIIFKFHVSSYRSVAQLELVCKQFFTAINNEQFSIWMHVARMQQVFTAAQLEEAEKQSNMNSKQFVKTHFINSKLEFVTILLQGPGSVGKTCLSIQFVNDVYVEEYDPTIHDSYRKVSIIDDRRCVIDIIDVHACDDTVLTVST